MKISIVIPTYNCGQYIKKAIDSVLDQPYANKELIVIDGESNDNTVKILRLYKEKIKWISEKDNGQADAINKGFKMATGEIIAWLNADDYYESDIFGQISDLFQKNKTATIVYGNQKYVDKYGKLLKNSYPPKNIELDEIVNGLNPISQPSSFYRKSAVEIAGGLDDKLSFIMEYDLCIKLRRIGDFLYTNQFISNFTIRDDQKSGHKNLIKMDKELWQVSRKNGGRFFTKILILRIYNLIRHFLRLI